MRKSFLLLVVLIITIGGYAQTTYYWVGGLSSASWTTAASWNTALNGSGTSRSTPNYGDTLIFDGSNLGGASPVTGAALINNVQTDAIASLRLQNGANITFINSHAANANLTGNWARAAAVTGIIVNTTNGSNVFACTNTANVKVGAVITAPSSAVNGGVTYVTSVTPNVSFTTNLPALATATGTSLTVCQPNTWSGDGTILNVGDIVCTGTQSNLEQIISKVDNSTFFCAGSAQPQQAITSASTLKKVTPLSLTSPTNALYISANSSLTFNNPSTSRPLILFLAPGAKGTVEGLIELDLNTNTFNTGRIYVAPTGGAQLVFKSGSVFKSGELQYPFGAIANDDNNNVVFEAGSQAWYGLAAGTPINCIFGANYPQSVVKFNKGSLYVHNGGADRFTGYTFREFPNVTSAVDLTLFQPGIVDSVIIPAGLTINHSAGNTIALKGTFVNNGTFGLTNASNGPLLSFIGDGTYTQGLDLKGSGTGVVNYTNTTPASGGSFQRIIVGVDAKLNLQNNTSVQTYGQTTVFGTLNFGNAVINNVATSGTALSLRPTTTVPTVTTIYSVTKSNTLVLDSVTNFQQGMLISGSGIPANTYIVTSSQAGKIVWLSNPVTVSAGTTVTASVNPSSATIITANTGGLASSYTVTGTSIYGLPTGSTGINYRFEGATTTPFPSTSLVTARNLTLAANVTSNITDLRVSNTLELNSNILTIPAGDTVRVLSGNPISGSSASKYIVLQSNATTGERGFLRIGNINTATLFPVGTANSYLPVTITPAGSNEDYSVNTFTGVTEDAMPNGTSLNATEKAKMVDAVWHINNNFTPTGTAGLQLGWPSALEGSSFTNFTNSQIGIAPYNSGWGLAIGSGNNITNIANANYNIFGPFRISEVVNTVPVKFGTISATFTNDMQCKLNWQMNTEIDVAHYIVESSSDGVSFSQKGIVNSNNSKNYNFLDKSPYLVLNFYRIKAIDVNGSISYSSVIKLNVKSFGSLEVYPNPVINSTINLAITSTSTQEYMIELHDVLGQLLFTSKLKHNGGKAVYPIKIPVTIKSGIYRLNITSGSGNKQTKSIFIN